MSDTVAAEIPRHILDDSHMALKGAYARLYAGDGADGRGLFKQAGREALLKPASDVVERVLAEEAHGFSGQLAGAPLVTNQPVLDALARLGGPEQQAAWTGRLASGETVSALALIEAGASADVAGFAVTAEPSADGYVLNGDKLALASIDLVEVVLVVAKAGDGFVFALVDARQPGVQLSALAEGAPVGAVTLTGVQVPSDRVLGGKPAPLEEAERALSLLQLGQAARAAARLERALGLAIQAAKAGSADGKPLFKNQAVGFRLADLHADLMVTRAYVDESIARAEAGSLTPVDAAMLKLWTNEAEDRVLSEAAQIIGPLAYSAAYPLARLQAAARAEQAASGLRESLRMRIFRDGVAHDRSDTFDILTVGRDTSVLTDDYQLFRQSLRRFLQKEVEPLAKSWVANGDIPKEIWRKAAEAGLLGVRIPAEAGGGGGDTLHYIITSEEMGRSSAGPIVGPLFQSDGLADLVIDFGTQRQKDRWYPRFLAGEVPAFAVSEPQSGSDVRAFRTVAVRDGDEWVINGQKLWTSFATHADFFFVLAKTDPDNPAAMSFFLVDAKTPGMEPRRLKTRIYPAGDTCELFITDVRVPAEALVGEVDGQALAMTKKLLGMDRIQIGARAVGSADLAYRQTLDFVATRVVFGRNLIEFENTRSMLAQVRTELHAARAYIDYAFQRHAQGTLDFPTASVAKLWHPTFEQRSIDRLMQMFGGNAFVTDYTIAHQLAGARADRVLGGTDEMQRQAIAYAL